MYWTQTDGDAAIVKGGMDGTGLQVLRKEGIGSPSSIAVINSRVYWVDIPRERIEFVYADGGRHGILPASKHTYLVPQRIAIYKDELYWVGRAKDESYDTVLKRSPPASVDDHILAGNLTRVTGLSICGYGSQVQSRKNDCAPGHPCAGICLLSNRDSFRCVCPIGFESDGSSCRGDLINYYPFDPKDITFVPLL